MGHKEGTNIRLDIGCGRTWPDGWEGLDEVDFGQKFLCDLESVGLTEEYKLGGHEADDPQTMREQGIRKAVHTASFDCYDWCETIGDDSVEAIRMWNTIEHLTRPAALSVLNECWRVLMPGGVMEIVTPNAAKSTELAWQDPTHLSCWVPGTFTQYICGSRPRNHDGGFKKWRLTEPISSPENEPRDMLIRMTPRK